MCGLQEPVSKMIRISQLDKILKITADIDTAIGEMTV